MTCGKEASEYAGLYFGRFSWLIRSGNDYGGTEEIFDSTWIRVALEDVVV